MLEENAIKVGPDSEYKTIQEGIDAADNGQVVIIENGVYNESFICKKNIAIVGKENVFINPSCPIELDGEITLGNIRITNKPEEYDLFRKWLANESVDIEHADKSELSDKFLESNYAMTIKGKVILTHVYVFSCTTGGIYLGEGFFNFDLVHTFFNDGVNVCCGMDSVTWIEKSFITYSRNSVGLLGCDNAEIIIDTALITKNRREGIHLKDTAALSGENVVIDSNLEQGICSTDSTKIRIDTGIIINNAYEGLKLTGNSEIGLITVSVKNNGKAIGEGENASIICSSCYFENNESNLTDNGKYRFGNCAFLGSRIGIKKNASGSFDDSLISDSPYGISISSAGKNEINHTKIENIENAGISLLKGRGNVIHQCEITGCHIGIQYSSSSDSIISHCNISECGTGIFNNSEGLQIIYTSIHDNDAGIIFNKKTVFERVTVQKNNMGCLNCSGEVFNPAEHEIIMSLNKTDMKQYAKGSDLPTYDSIMEEIDNLPADEKNRFISVLRLEKFYGKYTEDAIKERDMLERALNEIYHGKDKDIENIVLEFLDQGVFDIYLNEDYASAKQKAEEVLKKYNFYEITQKAFLLYILPEKDKNKTLDDVPKGIESNATAEIVIPFETTLSEMRKDYLFYHADYNEKYYVFINTGKIDCCKYIIAKFNASETLDGYCLIDGFNISDESVDNIMNLYIGALSKNFIKQEERFMTIFDFGNCYNGIANAGNYYINIFTKEKDELFVIGDIAVNLLKNDREKSKKHCLRKVAEIIKDINTVYGKNIFNNTEENFNILNSYWDSKDFDTKQNGNWYELFMDFFTTDVLNSIYTDKKNEDFQETMNAIFDFYKLDRNLITDFINSLDFNE